MGLLSAAQQAIRRVSLTRDLSKLTQSSGDNVAYVSSHARTLHPGVQTHG